MLCVCVYEQVKLLMDAGADPSAQDSQGKTPLHWYASVAPLCLYARWLCVVCCLCVLVVLLRMVMGAVARNFAPDGHVGCCA